MNVRNPLAAALLLLLTGTLCAQNPPATTPPPAQAAPPPTPAPQQPANPPAAQPAAPPAAAPAPAPPPRKAPQARTKPEYEAYQKAAGEKELAAAESAAKDFEAKYPESELRGLLYHNLMARYEQADNIPKTIEMGRKTLEFFPDDSLALVTTAMLLAESTHDTDADRDQRFDEAERDASHAIATIDVGLGAPASWTPEQVQAARNQVLVSAHSAIGLIELRKNNDAAAEPELRQAIDLGQAQPYAANWYRLALCLDHQGKYADALAAVNKALALLAPGDPVLELARNEQDRLNKLTGTPGTPELPKP